MLTSTSGQRNAIPLHRFRWGNRQLNHRKHDARSGQQHTAHDGHRRPGQDRQQHQFYHGHGNPGNRGTERSLQRSTLAILRTLHLSAYQNHREQATDILTGRRPRRKQAQSTHERRRHPSQQRVVPADKTCQTQVIAIRASYVRFRIGVCILYVRWLGGDDGPGG